MVVVVNLPGLVIIKSNQKTAGDTERVSWDDIMELIKEVDTLSTKKGKADI